MHCAQIAETPGLGATDASRDTEAPVLQVYYKRGEVPDLRPYAQRLKDIKCDVQLAPCTTTLPC